MKHKFVDMDREDLVSTQDNEDAIRVTVMV
jgi:hypothetical protein